jgi:hypothetical protein
MAITDIDYVERKLQWMEERQIWPNGLRYLWTDAFGLGMMLWLCHIFPDFSLQASEGGIL